MSLLATAFRQAVHHGDDTEARHQMALAATFAGLGFGNAGVHIPHANAYPIAGRVKDFHPEGYPDDEPMVPHGMAVSLTAPEAFRWTFEASPERHLRAASLLAPDHAYDGPDALPSVLTDLMRDITIPNGLAAVGYDESDVDDLVEGDPEAAAPARHGSARRDRGGRGRDPHPVARAVVSRDRRRRAAHRGLTDVDDSQLARSLYASDASLYRIPPLVVVRPRDTDEIAATLAVARETGTPITMRGAGTSIAGNAIGAGIVVDTSRHLNRVLELDRDARTARVQPGVVHAVLQKQAVAAGLRFGPDPSTHTRCTVGGMIGNNACGSRALAYGRTVDNVEALTVLLADGTVVDGSADLLNGLVDEHLGTVRTEFGRFGRQVSGYSFEHLLPERGRRFDRFLVGTEGTLGLVLEATVRLVEDAPGPGARRARLPDDGRCGGRRTRPARAPARRVRGARPAHRGHGAGPPRAARPGAAGCSPRSPVPTRARPSRRPGPSPRPRASRTGSSPTSSSSSRCGGSARTAPGSRLDPSAGRPRQAGRTPRSRPRSSATTCATSTRC